MSDLVRSITILFICVLVQSFCILVMAAAVLIQTLQP